MEATKKRKRLTRWQRLLRAHRTHGRWLTSWQQAHAVGSVTISKVRSECRDHGWEWITRRNSDGHIEYTPAMRVS